MATKGTKHGGRRPGAGRPPKEQSDELRSLLDRAWPAKEREAVIKKINTEAKAGNVKAAALLMNYAFGKPVDRKEISGPGGEAVRFTLKLDNAGALE